MREARRDFMPVGKLLRETLKELESRTAAATADVERVWRAVVGEDLASEGRVRCVAGPVVEIDVRSSAGLAELKQFFGEKFLRALRQEGFMAIERVSFRLVEG
jgi:hypothetical protein